MHKVFISYHHENDQFYKEELLELNDQYGFRYGQPLFIDKSVDTGDISERLSDETIREKIRDEYLKDSTVTILLVGTETKNRKHVDWELYSSMYDGQVNRKSGILVVNLPSIFQKLIHAGHGAEEKRIVYPNSSWTSFSKRKEYEERYPYMPDRIIDNLLNPKAKISVTNWDVITDPNKLKALIEMTFRDRLNCEYDLSRPMRRQNVNLHPNPLFQNL